MDSRYCFSRLIFTLFIALIAESRHVLELRRQNEELPDDFTVLPEDFLSLLPLNGTTLPVKGGGAESDKHRFTTPTTTQKRFARTTPLRITFEENCDYLAHYCLKAYTTGSLCGRTIYYTYHTFKNYCLLDYVNCMERYEVWQVVHMGECFNVTELTEYLLYPYDDDYFLDQYYVLEDH